MAVRSSKVGRPQLSQLSHCLNVSRAGQSRRRVLPHDLLDLLAVSIQILLEECISICLRRTFWVWLIQQSLHAHQDVLECDSWLPTFVFVENAEADSSGWIDIWVEERWSEADFRWLRRVFCRFSYQIRFSNCDADSRGALLDLLMPSGQFTYRQGK